MIDRSVDILQLGTAGAGGGAGGVLPHVPGEDGGAGAQQPLEPAAANTVVTAV